MKIVIAGGGTGGHLFPAISVAEKIGEMRPGSETLFVFTGNRFERSVLGGTSFRYACIPAEGLKGRGLYRQGKAILKAVRGVFQSIRILMQFAPDVVIGFGSYSAGPVIAAARLLRMKTVLHEQNMLPGITNRLLAPIADRICVSFEKTAAAFDPKKTRVTGNPVRREILEPSPEGDGAEKIFFTVLVLGGSQGAHGINLAVLEALDRLSGKDRFFFLHQTGEKDAEAVRTGYAEKRVRAEVRPFFKKMREAYRAADLLICRAGASTIAEVTALGKASILVPFPFAADNHQVLNARFLEASGACETILQENLTGEKLAGRIEYYAAHPEKIGEIADAARRLGRPDAAGAIVRESIDLIDGFRHEETKAKSTS
jgi:UDP-N-acetylglucosamine--N-acetylmuramyl-(pentapeptide) pyrophosphoryl-undecaprenol N-acetylglucosamine transferase